MNNFIHAKSGLQVIKKKKKGKKNRRGRGKKGNGNANQEQGVNENGNSLYENFPQKKSQNNFFQRGKQQQHARQGDSKNFANYGQNHEREPLTIDSLYVKYSQVDPSIVLNVYENNNKDVMLTDFQLKEMASDIFGDGGSNKPPPDDLHRAFNPFDAYEEEFNAPELNKRISGMSTGLDENDSASYNEFETPPLSKHSSSQYYNHQDEEYLTFLEEGYKGDDITKDDLTTIIKVIRKSIGEEEDIDGNAYILEQYMNDLVLVQGFIEKKLALQKEKNSSKSGVSMHSRQDFPTLGGGGAKKKKGKFKPKPRKKKGRAYQEPVEKIETPFDRKKHKVVYESKEVDLISQMKKERAEERKRIDEERTRKGIIGGFTLDGKSYKASRSGVQKSEWNMFQKDLFFTGGSSESQHIFFTLHSMFPRIMLGRLKVFYTQLGQNLHQTREFLMTEFPEYYRPGAQLPNQGVRNPNFVKIGAAFNPQNDDADFGLEESKLKELKRMDIEHLNGRFQELRTKVRNLQKVYYLCSKHGKAARNKKDHTKANGLLNHRRKTEMSLGCMKEESVYIAYEICRRQGFKKLDLHGLYLEEAEEVVMLVIDKVERMQKINRRSKSRSNFYLEIVTGKGRHSKGKAVLFPKIKAYLESQKYVVKKSQDNGRIIVKL